MLINFRQFLEREDLSKIESIKTLAETSLNNLFEHYRQFYNIHFPKKKPNQDNHEYIMNLHSMSQKWDLSNPVVPNTNVKIIISPMTTGLGGKRFNGEFARGNIFLYQKTIGNLIQELKHNFESYLYNLSNNKPNKAALERRQAKRIHENLMTMLQMNREQIYSTLYHEIIHATRHSHIKNLTVPMNKVKDLQQIYVNSPVELDAYFLNISHEMLSQGFNGSFDDFMFEFKKRLGADHFNVLSGDNKKRLISRLYQLWKQVN